jgi:hypothetical protein
MRSKLSLIVLACTLGVAGCGGDDAVTTTTATTTTPAPPTTTTLPPEAAQCSDALADPGARFVIVPPLDVFACFDTNAYRSRASYEGTPVFPSVPATGSARVESDQLIDAAGEPRSRTVATSAGAVYVTLQIGDALYLDDGTPVTDQIPIDVFQSQLAMNQAISDALNRFAGVTRDLGTKTLSGIETHHRRAEAADIALTLEEQIARDFGGEPFALELPGSRLDLWADSRGIVLKVDFAFDAAAATADGIPATDFLVGETPLERILPAISGAAAYEIYDFGADVTVELP